MKCLIIAAGRGSRLQHKGEPKPLVKLLGVPLIERVIRTAIKAGADDFFVVLGYKADEVKSFLADLSRRLNIPITTIYNDKWSEFENGYSILKAKDYLDEPFLLSMCDHLVDEGILKKLIQCDVSDGRVFLAADVRKDNELVDLNDVTKVKLDGNVIVDIGKHLKDYDAYDMGVFLCSPVIFDALEQAVEEGRSSLSAAVKILGQKGKALICPIDKGFWMDVDTEDAYKKAERYLLKNLRKKTDGPVSYYLNRPISIRISKILSKFRITPNQITIFSFILSLLGAYLISLNSYLLLAIGGAIAQFASIVDGCDGEIARLKFLSTKGGAWLDRVLDRYSDGFLILALTIHLLRQKFSFYYVFAGFLAVIGSFVVSYTAIWYDKLIREKNLKVFRIGRDLRIFLMFLGCILNLPFIVIIVIAIVMNLEAIRRLTFILNQIH